MIVCGRLIKEFSSDLRRVRLLLLCGEQCFQVFAPLRVELLRKAKAQGHVEIAGRAVSSRGDAPAAQAQPGATGPSCRHQTDDAASGGGELSFRFGRRSL